MVGSLSSGSSGPNPVISSRISVTKSLSSCWLSASRSTRMYWVTSWWTCERIWSSGIRSRACRLISSISRRCRRTLASSSLSVSNGLLAGACATGSGTGSGSTVQGTSSSAAKGARTGPSSGAGARFTVNRPAILVPRYSKVFCAELACGAASAPCPGQFEFLGRSALCRGRLCRRLRHDQLLELQRDLVARLDLVERNAAVDGFAHEAIVVRDAGRERIAQHLRDVASAQAGRE